VSEEDLQLCSECHTAKLGLFKDPYSGRSCCSRCWTQRALDAERALREQKRIYVVLSLTNTQNGMAIGPVNPGAFWTKEEAARQVENLMKMGEAAWAETVALGHFDLEEEPE